MVAFKQKTGELDTISPKCKIGKYLWRKSMGNIETVSSTFLFITGVWLVIMAIVSCLEKMF